MYFLMLHLLKINFLFHEKVFVDKRISIYWFFSQSQVLITLLTSDYLNTDKLKFELEGRLIRSNVIGMESNNYARFFNPGFYFDILMKNQWHLYIGTLVKSNLVPDKHIRFLPKVIQVNSGRQRKRKSFFSYFLSPDREYKRIFGFLKTVNQFIVFMTNHFIGVNLIYINIKVFRKQNGLEFVFNSTLT